MVSIAYRQLTVSVCSLGILFFYCRPNGRPNSKPPIHFPKVVGKLVSSLIPICLRTRVRFESGISQPPMNIHDSQLASSSTLLGGCSAAIKQQQRSRRGRVAAVAGHSKLALAVPLWQPSEGANAFLLLLRLPSMACLNKTGFHCEVKSEVHENPFNMLVCKKIHILDGSSSKKKIS